MTSDARVLAVSGLASETGIARGPGVVVLAGGGNATRLAALIEDNIRAGVGALISFGIAGGLEPGLAPGTILVASTIHDGAVRFTSDPAWAGDLARALPRARVAEIAGVDEAICDVRSKAELRARTGSSAVDMESHIVARLAARYRLPLAALRVVSDPAERALPAAALAGMAPDGTTDIGAVLLSLIREPRQLPGLIRTALDARAAFLALKVSRQALPHFAWDQRPGTPNAGTPVQG